VLAGTTLQLGGFVGATLCCTDQQLGEVSPRHLLS